MINKSNGFDLKLNWSFPEGGKFLFPFISLLFCLIIIYSNSLDGAWIFDDELNIVTNKHVHLTTLEWDTIQKTFYGHDQKKICRPIAFFSFGLNYFFGHLNVFGYHIVNLSIHFISSFFLFLFIQRTLSLPLLKKAYGQASYPVALLSSFFWAVNPLHVTAITYIVQRMASLAGMFYIISMYFYLVGRTGDKISKKTVCFTLSALSAVLAFGSKENAVMLPISLFLFDLLLIQGITKQIFIRNLRYFILPTVATAAFVLIFFIDLPSITGDYSIWAFSMKERLYTEARVIVFYISLLFYPTYSRLMFDHDFVISRSLLDPWTTLAAILTILCGIVLMIWFARKKPLITYCMVFFLLNHIIEGSFIPLGLIFEHRNYIPSMFLFLPVSIFIAYVIDYFSYKKILQFMIAGLICFILIAQGHTVRMYNFIFKDPYLLWSDNIAKAPNLSRPLNNIGNILWKWGLYEDAYKSFEKSYQLDKYDMLLLRAAPIHNMGRYYFYKKDYATAMTYFLKAASINPRSAQTSLGIARTQIQLLDFKGGEDTARKALENWPDNAWLNYILSFSLLKQGSFTDSIRVAWKTIAIDQEITDVTRVLAESYRRTGHIDRAVLYWEKYVSKYRDDIEGYLALIELYSKTEKTEQLYKTIAKIMILKGSTSWRELMKEYTGELAVHAYEPDPELLLGIIKRSLLNGI